MKVRVTRQKRRGGKVWVVDWTDRSGKRHQPRFDTKEAAEAEEERIRATLRAQHGRTPELPEDTTWTGLFERVMADRGDLKPRTLESYRETQATSRPSSARPPCATSPARGARSFSAASSRTTAGTRSASCTRSSTWCWRRPSRTG